MSGKIKNKEIECRRAKILEMRAQGLSQTEIASQLNVSDASISLDLQYLRKKAKETLKDYSGKIALQYELCQTALDMVIKHAYSIIQATPDNIDKIDALDYFTQANFLKLRLLYNYSNTLDSTLNFLQNYQQQQQGQDSISVIPPRLK